MSKFTSTILKNTMKCCECVCCTFTVKTYFRIPDVWKNMKNYRTENLHRIFINKLECFKKNHPI